MMSMTVSSRRRVPRRAGFTLLELSAGLVASSVLMIGMAGSLFLATQANRVDLGPFHAASQAAFGMDEVTRELSYATAVRSITANRSIEIELPDRTGDGASETLRYQWSGTAGDPFVRVFNGTTATVVPGLQALTLSAATKSVTEPGLGQVTNTSGEALWSEKASGWIEGTLSIAANEGAGAIIAPKLPEGATSWTLTRVDIRCQSNSTLNGVIRARFWSVDANWQPATLLAETTFNESTLPSSMAWYTVTFPGAPSLAASQRGCVTFQYVSGTGTVIQLRFDDFGFQSQWRVTTSDGGANWNHQVEKALFLRVYGTYSSAMEGIVDVNRTYFTTVGVEAQPSTESTSRTTGAARFRNQPELRP
jgi:hypothetical protein